MKLKITSLRCLLERRRSRLREWHLWYAWRPVRISNRTVVWLEKVYRKSDYWGDDFEYQIPEDFQP